MDIGNKISKLRERRGLSQVQLAEKLHMSQGSLGMYETGKRKPSLETLELIADFFNVSTDYLLGREEGGEKIYDIDEMINNAMMFKGEPLTENDREILRGVIEGYLKAKK